MKKITEIYLKKSILTSNDIEVLIREISSYQGVFRKWKIFILLKDQKIRMFLETIYALPISLDSVSFCMLKEIEQRKNYCSKRLKKRLTYISLNDNLITLYEKLSLKKGENLIMIEMDIFPLSREKEYSKTYLYLEKENQLYKKRTLLSLPTFLLNIDLEMQKLFSYQKMPKYFNVQKIFPLLKSKQENTLLKIDSFPYSSKDLYLGMEQYDFFKHSLVIGASGSGKSKLISLLISKLDRKEYQVIVIDPHAALEQEIGGLDKTRVIDFKSIDTTIQLFASQPNNITASVELMISLFHNLMVDYYNPKLERVLRHSIHLLLIGNLFNFTNLRRFILELDYRMFHLKELEEYLPQNILDFFYTDFNELKTKSYMESIAPIISFIDEMQMLPVFSKETKEKSLDEVLQESFLTIFSLDRTSFGDKIVKTIAGFLMQQILEIAQRRETTKKLVLVVDEVAVIENPVLIRMLSETRKYGLSLILIGQYLNQLSPTLKDSIFANTINYYIFRTSRIDATVLVDHLNMDMKENVSKEDKITFLTKLNNRECMIRISAKEKIYSAVKGVTLDFKPIPYIKKKTQLKIERKLENRKKELEWKGTNIPLRSILEKLTTTKRRGIK